MKILHQCYFFTCRPPLPIDKEETIIADPAELVEPIPPKRKRLYYPGDIPDNIEASTPQTLIKYVDILKEKFETQDRIIRRLNRKCLRQAKTIQKYHSLAI